MIFEDLPPMEEPCAVCKSTGQIPWKYEQKVGKKVKTVDSKKTCTACNGKGKFLTPFGMALIKLVQEWSPWDQELQYLRDDIRDLERHEPYDRQRD